MFDAVLRECRKRFDRRRQREGVAAQRGCSKLFAWLLMSAARRRVAVEHRNELVQIDRLEEQRRQLLVRQAVHLVLDLVHRHAGEQDDRQAAAVLLEVVQHVEAVDVRHLQVEQQQIDFVAPAGRSMADLPSSPSSTS